MIGANQQQQQLQGGMQPNTTSAYDPYQLSTLMGSQMSLNMFNQMSQQLQQQWNGQYGNQVMGQSFAPYKRAIDQHGMAQTTYTQNGTYSMSPEQLSRLFQTGYISGIGPNGYTTGKMSLNTLPQYRTAGTMYNY